MGTLSLVVSAQPKNTQCMSIPDRETGSDPRRSAIVVLTLLALAGCLNTQSVAFEEQPAALESPAAACRAAAEADGWTVIDVTNVVRVSEGYWEARFVVDDPDDRNALGCRHSPARGFTEVIRLDG